jgi:hypothetical protein
MVVAVVAVQLVQVVLVVQVAEGQAVTVGNPETVEQQTRVAVVAEQEMAASQVQVDQALSSCVIQTLAQLQLVQV